MCFSSPSVIADLPRLRSGVAYIQNLEYAYDALHAYQVLPVRLPSLNMNAQHLLCWLFVFLVGFYIKEGYLTEVCPLLMIFQGGRAGHILILFVFF